MMEKAKFKKVDEGFKCDVCGKLVIPLGYTSRDHCPYCLYSKHVDLNPGDRECSCHGFLKPIAIEKGKKDNYKIVYLCQKCKMIKRNVAAKDDNLNLIIELMSNF